MNVKSIEKGKSNSAMMLDRIGVYIYIYILTDKIKYKKFK